MTNEELISKAESMPCERFFDIIDMKSLTNDERTKATLHRIAARKYREEEYSYERGGVRPSWI